MPPHDLDALFEPFALGSLTLPNRLVMAPLTRNRVGEDGVPNAMLVDYYAQRATAGLIIAEATQVCPEGQGYGLTPGIHTQEQIAGWRQVTDAVHQRGGRIFLQLWHVGRVSNVLIQPGGKAPIAPSAIRAQARTWIAGEFLPTSEPVALDIEEIPGIVEAHVQGARNAMTAGFDGVELHGANGYLIDQFLRDGSNQRTDAYGGSIANRVRFMCEVVDAVSRAVGADKVGIRLSPVTPSNGAFDSDPVPLFYHAVESLNPFNLAYLHVIEGETRGARDYNTDVDYARLRRSFRGTYMANNGYTQSLAAERIAAGHTDLVAFGRSFLANPDLVERFRLRLELNTPDNASFYGGDRRGYTDYPVAGG
ncbi:alkene reductase [Devosia sp. A449]